MSQILQHQTMASMGGVTGLVPDASTPPGTSPVTPNGGGNIVIEGGTLINTDSTGANTLTLNLDNGTDGQLIIGSTAGSPAYASVTSSDGSITVTGGSNTLDLITNNSSAAGQILLHVQNRTGVTIAKDQLVSIGTGNNDPVEIVLADASAISTMPGIGYTIAAIDHLAEGDIVVFGLVENVPAWSALGANTPLYASATPGDLTDDDPDLPTESQQIAAIQVYENGANSKIFILGNTFQPETLGNVQDILFQDTGLITSNRSVGHDYTLSAWNTNTLANIPFITLTAGNPPTCDLDTAVTLGGNYIYRAGGIDVPVTDGGTGRSSHTAYAVLCGGTTTTGAQQSIASVGTSGQVLTSNGAGALPTFQAASGGGITWSEVTGTSQAMAVDNGYILNNAGLVTATLPDTAALGSVVRVVGKGAGGWKIAQNAGETIIWDESSSTTTGVGGSLASTDDYDSVELLCTVADTTWTVLSSKGNITVV